MAAKSDEKFIITHKIIDGTHYLIFSPSKKNEGYPPKSIEISVTQWEALKFHFAVGYPDNGDERLIYVY